LKKRIVENQNKLQQVPGRSSSLVAKFLFQNFLTGSLKKLLL